MYLAKYISWIGRAAILSLESEEFICLLVLLNTARKKSSLPLSLETPGHRSCIVQLLQACSKCSGLDRIHIKNSAYKVLLELQMFWIFCANVKPGCIHAEDGKAVQLLSGIWLGTRVQHSAVRRGCAAPIDLCTCWKWFRFYLKACHSWHLFGKCHV